MSIISRRSFLASTAASAAAICLKKSFAATLGASPFQIAVITDEISMDFDHACFVASREFGMRYVELRAIGGKNLQALSDAELAEAQRILAKYQLTVTDIASPLFKTHWPGAPRSRYGDAGDMHSAAETTFKQQDEVAERAVAQALRFKTNKVRCFDFWRLDNPAPFRAAMNDKLRQTAEAMRRHDVQLVLENEFECNTATGREAAATLASVPSSNFFLNWDPGNAVMRGELDAFPAGWELLPKERIHHCHVKNCGKDASGKLVWEPVGTGYINWTAQFAALKASGYRHAVSLETHWAEGGSPEASTRKSWADMRAALVAAHALA
jgi:sugar phosphate isomerase/epimerase